MRILRNVFRRKVRSILTILGIVIGVFALIAMGSMAEKLTVLVDGGSEYYKDKAIVSEGGGMAFMASPMSKDRVKDVESVEGVTVAQAEINMLLEDLEAVNFGQPPMIIGSDLRGQEYESFEVTFAKGRDIKEGDRKKVVVGSDLVNKLGAVVGKEIKIRGEKFEVIGILEKTLTGPDLTVVMTLTDAQELYHKTLPDVLQKELRAENLITGVTAFVDKDYDPDKVAKKIGKEIEGLSAMGPQAFQDQIGSAVGVFSAIVTLIGLVALMVGGLSVVNTMSMSIAERTKEIGIRKAIGASSSKLIRQFLAESGVIGIIGGLIGLGLGIAFTTLVNSAGNESGTSLFLVTPRLAISAVLFALILGIIGGFFPAWRASRLNPVEALRYE